MAIKEKLEYVLSFDTKQAQDELKRLGKAGDDTIRRTDKIGNAMIGAGAAMVTFAGVGGKALWSLGRGASDLNESINATEVTFGDAADGIKKLGDEAAEALGLSKAEFLQMSTGFAAFAKTIAGDGGDVVKTIDDLTTRASDFASVMNLDVGRAMQLFRSGLAGETESLRQFGIDVSSATVEQFALANGLARSKKELTEQVKIQARYGVILEQTSHMAGDFANTSGDLANSQRILSAQFKDLQDNIGTGVLPMMEQLVSMAGSVAGVFTNLSPTTQTFIGRVAGIGVAISGILGALTMFVGGMVKVSTAMNASVRSAKLLRATLMLLKAAAVPAGVAMVGMYLHMKKTADEAKRAADAIDDFSKATDEALVARFAEALLKGAFAADGLTESLRNIAEETPGTLKRMLDMEEETGAVTRQLVAMGASTEEARRTMEQIAFAYVEARDGAIAASEGQDALAEDIEDVTGAGEDAIPVVEELGEATDEAGRIAGASAEEYDEMKSAVQEAREAMDDMIEASWAAANADLALRREQSEMNDTLAAYPGIAAEAWIQQEALNEMTDNGIDSGEKYEEQVGKTKEAHEAHTDALFDGEAQAIATAEAEKQLAMKLAEQGGQSLTTAEQDEVYRQSLQAIADKAEGPLKTALDNLIAQLDEAAKDREGTVTVHFNTSGYDTVMARKRIASARGGSSHILNFVGDSHDGGVVTRSGVNSFDGLKPDEVPRILQEGEAVLTPEQQGAMLAAGPGDGGGSAGGPVTMNVMATDPKMLLAALREVERMTGKKIVS